MEMATGYGTDAWRLRRTRTRCKQPLFPQAGALTDVPDVPSLVTLDRNGARASS